MAWRMGLKLPTFKITQRTVTNATARHRNVPRGRKDDTGKLHEHSTATTAVEEKADPLMVEPPTFEGADVDMQGPSLHTIKEKAVTAAWSKVRPALLKSAVECNAMPTTQRCILCPANATYRCIQCAPWAYFCPSCFGEAHSRTNIFHIGEVWKVKILVLCKSLNC